MKSLYGVHWKSGRSVLVAASRPIRRWAPPANMRSTLASPIGRSTTTGGATRIKAVRPVPATTGGGNAVSNLRAMLSGAVEASRSGVGKRTVIAAALLWLRRKS